MQSLISPDSHLAIWAVLLASSAFGVYAEKKGWIKNIAGVMYTMVFTAILAHVHILQSASGLNSSRGQGPPCQSLSDSPV